MLKRIKRDDNYVDKELEPVDISTYRYTGSIPVYRRAALKTGGSGTWARQTGGIPVWAGRGAISPLLYPTFAYFLFKFCVSWNTTQCGHHHRQMSRGDRVRSGRSGCMPSILKYHIHTRSFHSKVCMYQMDPRTRCVRRKNVLEMGIARHTRSH